MPSVHNFDTDFDFVLASSVPVCTWVHATKTLVLKKNFLFSLILLEKTHSKWLDFPKCTEILSFLNSKNKLDLASVPQQILFKVTVGSKNMEINPQ